MLTNLKIQNLAVISECEIEFGPGFTVLTGETGAGKSIIIDAISLLMGIGSGESLIRTGEDIATVEGIFLLDTLSPELESFVDEDRELIVYRRISRGKPGVIRVNGQAIAAKQLKVIMKSVVGITGQHDQLALFGADYQLRLVDQFAETLGIGDCLARYRDAYKDWQAVKVQYDQLVSSEGQLSQKIGFLQFQIDDIDQHHFVAEEEEELNRAKKELNQQAQVGTQVSDAIGALTQIETAAHRYSAVLKKVTPVLTQFASLAESANELILVAEDHIDQLEKYRQSVAGFESMDVDAIESRLDVIFKLKTKYKALDLPALIRHLDSMKAEVAALTAFETTSQELLERKTALELTVVSLARELGGIRSSAAETISQLVREKLIELGFNQAEFIVDVQFDASRLTSLGGSTVEMQIAPNPGEAVKPLNKVASGGELSRIMLAINAVFFELNPMPTLIFDEVDAGVGGLTALRIGELLKLIARSSQVFCITHLPQIAQLGDCHFVIEKRVANGRTATSLTAVGGDDRSAELRRMVGGDVVVAQVSMFPAGEAK